MIDPNQLTEALQMVIDPIRNHDRPMLWLVATDLKQSSGEGWAVGEMLERACILLDMLDVDVRDGDLGGR